MSNCLINISVNQKLNTGVTNQNDDVEFFISKKHETSSLINNFEKI